MISEAVCAGMGGRDISLIGYLRQRTILCDSSEEQCFEIAYSAENSDVNYFTLGTSASRVMH